MKFGLVGTGYWARKVHLAGLRAADGATPVAVWGRDAEKVARVAGDEGLDGFTDVEGFLERVDAVAFAVPPFVQVELGIEAAGAGKHLLLEKPVALDVSGARALEAAAQEAGVATVVFVTAAYSPERRAWAEQLRSGGTGRGAAGVFLSSAVSTDNPFNTPWRREKGALWDIGPHILNALEEALGPVSDVAAAVRGEKDLVHLVLRHESGATSTATASIAADPRVSRADLVAWTDSAAATMPPTTTGIEAIYATAVRELITSASTGAPHPHGVHDGRRIVELLAAAERLMS